MNSQTLIKGYMQQELSQMRPYEPIQFIYTETIGSVNQKMKEILDPYIWADQDILIPKVINNHNFVFYYMFHTAPIYNWLRQIPSKQTTLLKQYIDQKNIPNLKSTTLNSSKLLLSKATKFDSLVFYDSLKKYVAKWEIAKLCAAIKINIKTTRQGEISKNNQIKCAHLIKTQQSTLNYIFSHISKTIQCNKFYCQQCQNNIDIVVDIIKYPFTPIFKQFYGESLTFKMMNKSQNITYNVFMAFTKDFVYVKCANRIWYQIGNGTSRAISFDRIDFKKSQIVIYQNKLVSSQNSTMLRLAQPLILKEFQDQIEKHKNLYSKDQKDQQSDNYDQPTKNKAKKQHIQNFTKGKLLQKSIKVDSQIQKPFQDREAQEVLQQLKKQAPLIVLNKKKVDTKVYREYKDKIQSLFDKPKMKDQYELDYDKGKTKKIKKKVDYIKPDFFNLYKDIQVQNSYGRPHQVQNEQLEYRKGSKHSRGQQGQFSNKQKKKYHGSTMKNFKKYPKQKFKNNKYKK